MSAASDDTAREDTLRDDKVRQDGVTDPKSALQKAPYEKPVLSDYGDIRTLTQDLGPHGADDGGIFPGFKSSQP